VCYVVYGETARREAELSMQSLRLWHDLPVSVIGEPAMGADCVALPQADAGGRWAKVSLDQASPYTDTLYLDADTRPHGDLSAGFAMLADGWDLVICPSMNQGEDLLWHVGADERAATLRELAFEPLQLQAGVFFFRKNERTAALYRAWRAEWLRFRDQDQAALLRALTYAPVRAWLVGHPWNGGALVDHRFGACRRKG